MDIVMTKHASDRQQQRKVPPLIIHWLAEFGATEYDHRGGRIHYFDKQSRKRLAAEVGSEVVDRLGGLMDAYAVVGDGDAVITVGYRFKRIKGH